MDYGEVATRLRDARSVAVLTGAGVSAESGVATFRGPGGLWEGHRVEDVATPGGFARDPMLVWRFYNSRRSQLPLREPNPAHLALRDMESALDHFTLITQNVDGLHRRAGSQNVIELHGSIWLDICTGCGYHEWVEERWRSAVAEGRPGAVDDPRCPACGSRLRPGVVWFEEPLPPAALDRAERAARNCDVFLVVGTSGVVYPAAGLAHVAAAAGAYVVEINLTTTPLSRLAHATLLGKAGEVLPNLVGLAALARRLFECDPSIPQQAVPSPEGVPPPI